MRGNAAVQFHFAILLLLCTTLSLPPIATAAEDATEPSQVVESLHAILIQAMQNSETLDYQGRHDLIAPIVQASIDQQFMAEKSIGRHWKKLSEDDQKRWTRSFANLTVANYAGRFVGFSGEYFQTKGTEDAPHDTKLVKTVLILPEDDDVILNYRLRATDDGWRIVDIYMNGTVSELSLRRSEYSTTLKRDGFEALVSALEGKIQTFSKSQNRQFASPATPEGSASP